MDKHRQLVFQLRESVSGMSLACSENNIVVDVPKIVLTGGPCAGKSLFLSQARQLLSGRGYEAVLVPEVATEMFANGISDATGFSHDDFEGFAVQKQLFDEDFYCAAARARSSAGHHVVICDRGLADARCYMSDKSLMDVFLSGMGKDYRECLESYDLVVHMRTVAASPHGTYLADDNPARREKTIQAALDADEATLAEWAGHPNLVIVENEKDFDWKVGAVLDVIVGFLDGYFQRL